MIANAELVGFLRKNVICVICVAVSIGIGITIYLRMDQLPEAEKILADKSKQGELIAANIEDAHQLKELQSSIGFYEVQTGQSVGQVICIQLSPKLAWLEGALASSLGIATLKFDPLPWLRSRRVTVPDALTKTAGEFRWFGLLSLMVQYTTLQNGAHSDEKK